MAPTTSLVPSNDLTVPTSKGVAIDPNVKSVPPNRFIIFGSQWLKLQTFIAQALELPINKGDWDAKYGNFSDKTAVQNCLIAFKSIKDLSASFGNPVTLKDAITKDQDYLQTLAPPKEIYAHIVWLANQIENQAGTFANTLPLLQQLLGPTGGTKKQRANNLKEILIGKGGLASTADEMKQKTNDLMKKLLAFEKDFNTANGLVQEYASTESSIFAAVDKLIGKLGEDIKQTQNAADDAYSEWRSYTIAAVTVSVGLTIIGACLGFPFLGVLAGIGAAAGFGYAANQALESYNKLCDKVKEFNIDLGKKSQLSTDLTGLNTKIADIAPAMTEFKNSLQMIEGVWNDVSMNLNFIATNYTDDQLSDVSWVIQAMRIHDAQKKWQDIARTAGEFSRNSLVSYDFKPFGVKLAS
jgi:hypothetical protein